MNITHKLAYFHLTGDSSAFIDAPKSKLYPVLMNKYKDLSRVRNNFPLILSDNEQEPVKPLYQIMDEVLRKAAFMGTGDSRLSKIIIQLEDKVRSFVNNGAEGSFSELCDYASRHMLIGLEGKKKEQMIDDINLIQSYINNKGLVADFDEKITEKFFTHIFRVTQRKRGSKSATKISGYAYRLSEILNMTGSKSGVGDPSCLKASVGKAYEEEFDFDFMSKMLTKSLSHSPLSQSRYTRLRLALAVLGAQKFFSDGENSTYKFEFENIDSAMEAFESRLTPMVELVKSIQIAQLEAENLYIEKIHDDYFNSFTADTLTKENIEMFPSYLIILRGDIDELEFAKILNGDLTSFLIIP